MQAVGFSQGGRLSPAEARRNSRAAELTAVTAVTGPCAGQVIPESEYTVGTMASALVALNLLATHAGPRRLRFRSARANRTHVLVALDGPLARPPPPAPPLPGAPPCAAYFDAASVAALGPGAQCFWPGPALLAVRLGAASRRAGAPGGLANGTVLRAAGPVAGFSNGNTDYWRTAVPVAVVPDDDASGAVGGGAPAACALGLRWEELVELKVTGERVMSGGLGLLARPPDLLVWACVPATRATGGCSAGRAAGAAECFMYNESAAGWVWMGGGPEQLGID